MQMPVPVVSGANYLNKARVKMDKDKDTKEVVLDTVGGVVWKRLRRDLGAKELAASAGSVAGDAATAGAKRVWKTARKETAKLSEAVA
jgi:hypothetical protein